MKKRVLIFITAAALLASALLIFLIEGKTTDHTAVDSTERSESGVKKRVVELPGPDKIAEQETAITLIEESEEDENYMFRYIVDLQVDEEGNIFIIDSKRILRYDAGGTFLERIGSPGQGPGEYVNPRNLFIDRHRLYINDVDGRKLLVYNPGRGKKRSTFVKNIPLESYLRSAIFIDRDENIFGITHTYSKSGAAKVLIKLDKYGQAGVNVSEPMPYMHVEAEMHNGGGVVAWLPHCYSAELLFEPLRPNRLCLAENLYYKIEVLDLAGKHLFTIQQAQQPCRITRQELKYIREWWGKEIFEQSVFPPTRPIIEKILTDEQGRIYIVHKPSVLEEKKPVKVDVYDFDGNYLCKTGFYGMPRIISKNHCYIIDRKKNDEIVVKKIKMAL